MRTIDRLRLNQLYAEVSALEEQASAMQNGDYPLNTHSIGALKADLVMVLGQMRMWMRDFLDLDGEQR